MGTPAFDRQYMDIDSAQREKIKRYAPLNLDALLDQARLIRKDDCKCVLTDCIIGSESILLTLRFENNIEWIAKVPWKQWKDNHDPNPVKIETEVATMKFVRANTTIPVPEVFGYSAHSNTCVKWPYIFMGKVPGQSLASKVWSRLTLTKQSKVMRELAKVLHQLSLIRFDLLGSLVLSSSGYAITCCVRRSFNAPYCVPDLHIDSGPFNSSETYYRSLLSLYRADISHPESTSRLPFLFPLPLRRNFSTQDEFLAADAAYNDPTFLRDDYVSSEFNISLYERLCVELDTALPQMVDFNRTTFVLEHPDLNHSNIFVDRDFAITGIIDWEYASTVPLETLCVPPHLPGRRDPLPLQLRYVFEDAIRDLEQLPNSAARIYRTRSGVLFPQSHNDNDSRKIFSELLSCQEPMWAYDRLIQNETGLEFHPILNEFLSWKLGTDWRTNFANEGGG